MKNTKIKIIFAAFILFSISGTAISANAAPILFFQLAQAGGIKSDKGSSGCFEKCLVNNDLPAATDEVAGSDLPTATDILSDDLPVAPGDDKKAVVPQDERVITETKIEIVEDDACECADIVIAAGGFPFAYLALPLPALLFAGVGGDSDVPEDPEVVSPIRP